MYIRYKGQGYGWALVAADEASRREFGPSIFRIGEGESHCMDGLILKIDLKKLTLQLIDQDEYLNGNIVWQAPVKLERVVLRNEELIVQSLTPVLK